MIGPRRQNKNQGSRMATEQQNKDITQIIYGLHAASLIAGGITSIVAVILNYVKREDVIGTMFESHFRWQIRTFWFSLLWFVIGGILMFAFFIGALVWIAMGIWFIYRIVLGWLRLSEGKAMYE
jgi:uncharacterized membrane protein